MLFGVPAVLMLLLLALLAEGTPSAPRPIVFGRDRCGSCGMHLSRAGFGGELRHGNGVLETYDDLGCLFRGLAKDPAAVAWVESHESGALIPLERAIFVRGEVGSTPMASGLLAFESGAGAAEMERSGGSRVGLAELYVDIKKEQER
jgi:hypothetical protein